MPDSGRLSDHGQGATHEWFGHSDITLNKTRLQKARDEFFELETAQGGLGFELSKERIGQIKRGSHKNIYMRKCSRVKGAGRLRQLRGEVNLESGQAG